MNPAEGQNPLESVVEEKRIVHDVTRATARRADKLGGSGPLFVRALTTLITCAGELLQLARVLGPL